MQILEHTSTKAGLSEGSRGIYLSVGGVTGAQVVQEGAHGDVGTTPAPGTEASLGQAARSGTSHAWRREEKNSIVLNKLIQMPVISSFFKF